ncbi:hypothetical protein ACTXT7_001034 [Hymenolepis weldensis]
MVCKNRGRGFNAHRYTLSGLANRTGKVGVIMGADTLEEEHPQLLIDKLNFCCTVFDFTLYDPSKLPGKKAKTAALKEISAYLFESPAPSITSEEEVYAACIQMFAANIFRPLPPPSASSLVSAGHPYEPPDSADEEDTLEPAWPHLELTKQNRLHLEGKKIKFFMKLV